jgi:hypothetical protein
MLPGPSLASYVSAGVIPPYFVSVAFTGKVAQSPAVAVVHDTVSGHALATIRPPIRGGTIVGVSAAGDDRTFVLDEQFWVKPKYPFPTAGYPGPHSFYLLRLSSAGRVSSLGRLRVTVPATQVLRAFALSPDGQRLALAVQSRKNLGRTELMIVTLSTGSTRVWAAVREHLPGSRRRIRACRHAGRVAGARHRHGHRPRRPGRRLVRIEA